MERADRFDAIVIGSGMGGLATASILAGLRGWRVAVLDGRPEGVFTAGLTREVVLQEGSRRFSWNGGLSYMAGMEPGSTTRRLMDLVTSGEQEWARLPDPMEQLVFPDLTVEVPVGERAMRERLHDAFPRATRAIDRAFTHFRRAASWLEAHLYRESPPPLLSLARGLERFDERFSNRTVAEWLDEEVADPRLKGILGARWAEHGLPPEHASLAVHALSWLNHLEGAHVPVGGPAGIARGARQVIEREGGCIVERCEVSEILHEEGAAVGVSTVLFDGPKGPRTVRFDAPCVVSDAGARATYGALLRSPALERVAERAAGLRPIPTAVTLFVGLDRPARELGVSGATLWLHPQWSHAAIWRQRARVLEGYPQLVIVSFAASNDPLSEGHEVEITALLDAESLSEADEVSARTRAGLLGAVEAAIPGFRRSVAHAELHFPGTAPRFPGHPGGAIAGLPATPARFEGNPLGPETPLRGVVLTGIDAATPGAVGALMGGAFAAAALPGGPPVREILAASPR